MALVLVLWVTALMSVMVAALVYSGRVETRVVANVTHQIRLQAAAEAGLAYAIDDLLRPLSQRVLNEAGIPNALAWGNDRMTIELLHASGLIDLNSAPRALFATLLRGVGMEEGFVSSFLDAVEDWRDADDLRKPNGAESSDYERAGRAGPRNGLFESVEELNNVLGVTPYWYDKLSDFLTVHSSSATISDLDAPEALLQLLKGDQAAATIDQRNARTGVLVRSRSAGGGGGVSFGGGTPKVQQHVYLVRVGIRAEDGSAYRFEATVSLSPDDGRHYAVLSWRPLYGG